MAKPVTSEVFAAVPAGHHDQMIVQPRAVKHSDDHHASAAFAIIPLDRSAFAQMDGPAIVGGPGVFSIGFQFT